jgi:hypothetical protein
VEVVRLVVTLEPAGERPAVDVEIGIPRVEVLVGGTDRDLVVEAVLDAGCGTAGSRRGSGMPLWNVTL